MQNSIKNAILISLHEDIEEITLLAKSLDYKIQEIFIQNRKNPDVSYYIGSGKLEEIRKYIEEIQEQIDVIIVDGELKPSQWFALEKHLDTEVYDRIRLILMIFRDRAKRKEAQLQVRLAELSYEKPYVKELIHRTRSGEHPGLMAGGEYQVDDYYEMIKKQMKHIKTQLKKIEKERLLLRQHRKTGGYYLISLAGYTNAGKSSLLNILTEETVTVENRLFSTLSTITRRIEGEQLPILLTDTVGFIQRLPAWIIDAFHSTLEEIKMSDLVLLVVDGSDSLEMLDQKINTSLQELADLEVTSQVIIVVNKIDQITEEVLNEKLSLLQQQKQISQRNIVTISVKQQIGIENLLDMINKTLPDIVSIEITLPNNTEVQSFISWLYEKTHVLSSKYEKEVTLTLHCNPKIYKKIEGESKKLGGTIIEK